MKIESVAHSLPSWQVTNQEVVDLIRSKSKNNFTGDLEKTLRKISAILRKTGAETRNWLDINNGEKAVDHISNAVDSALSKANLVKKDIEVLIYVGIGRGFLEPGNGYPIAHSLGMEHARCFDVIDACMSWMTAMQIADSLFKAKAYKKIMIVNGEFTVQGGPLKNNFLLESEEQLEYTFPSFTIGEGATATILTPDNENNFNFNFISRPDLSDLCVIPLDEYKIFSYPTPKLGLNGPHHFSSFGIDLHDAAAIECQNVLKNSKIDTNSLDIVFTHASSKNDWAKYGREAGIEEKLFHIYHKTGNLVSASVPGAMSIAQDEGKLKRGDNVLHWVGSAGMSFSATNFVF